MNITYWIVIGFLAQGLFGLRFVLQWLASEKKGESFIPVYFWHISILASGLLLLYAIHRHDPVFIFGQSTGSIVYIRNLMLIHRKQ